MAKYLKYVSTDYSYKPVLLRALKHSPFLRLLVADWMSLFFFFAGVGNIESPAHVGDDLKKMKLINLLLTHDILLSFPLSLFTQLHDDAALYIAVQISRIGGFNNLNRVLVFA